MSGSAQWCPARTQIHRSAKASARSLIWILSTTKPNTPTLFSHFSLPMSRTCGNCFLNVCHLERVYSMRSFSINSISQYPPIDSIYSMARRRLTAPMMCGVPGSHLDGSPAGAKQSWCTQLIAPPPPNAGTRVFRCSFLP